MQKHLYFVCPTDYLEMIIDDTFKQENHYYASLGNSIPFDESMVVQIIELLETKNIKSISFILSEDNQIISDALKKQDFLGITGLVNFYHQIIQQKEDSEASWQGSDQALMLSYHLNNKIRELKLGLKTLAFELPRINGKIYNRANNIFYDIYSDLICREYLSLN